MYLGTKGSKGRFQGNTSKIYVWTLLKKIAVGHYWHLNQAKFFSIDLNSELGPDIGQHFTPKHKFLILNDNNEA